MYGMRIGKRILFLFIVVADEEEGVVGVFVGVFVRGGELW